MKAGRPPYVHVFARPSAAAAYSGRPRFRLQRIKAVVNGQLIVTWGGGGNWLPNRRVFVPPQHFFHLQDGKNRQDSQAKCCLNARTRPATAVTATFWATFWATSNHRLLWDDHWKPS